MDASSVKTISTDDLIKVTYNPTPISELNKIKNNSTGDPKKAGRHIPIQYTPQRPHTVRQNGFHSRNETKTYTPAGKSVATEVLYTPSSIKDLLAENDSAEVKTESYVPQNSTTSTSTVAYNPTAIESNKSESRVEYQPASLPDETKSDDLTFELGNADYLDDFLNDPNLYETTDTESENKNERIAEKQEALSAKPNSSKSDEVKLLNGDVSTKINIQQKSTLKEKEKEKQSSSGDSLKKHKRTSRSKSGSKHSSESKKSSSSSHKSEKKSKHEYSKTKRKDSKSKDSRSSKTKTEKEHHSSKKHHSKSSSSNSTHLSKHSFQEYSDSAQSAESVNLSTEEMCLLHEDDLSDGDSDDPLTSLEECKRIFEEYQPPKIECNPTIRKSIEIDIEPVPLTKKRIAHEKHHQSPFTALPRPEMKKTIESAAQMMARRYHIIKEQAQRRDQAATAVPTAPSAKRIARVPNVSSLMNAKKRVEELMKEKALAQYTPSQTIAKGERRVPHVPASAVTDLPMVLQAEKSRLPINVRTRYLQLMVAECFKLYSSKESVFERVSALDFKKLLLC